MMLFSNFKKSVSIIVFLFLLLSVIYFLGPAPSKPIYKEEYPPVPLAANELEAYITKDEAADQPLKPGNEARIIWDNDSLKQKTPYSLVYLHGFSASHEEGNPIHRWMAETYGMNLYLSRLADHGKASPNALLHFTAESAWHDALEAVAIGKAIGEKVILISTSTGGTLSLMLTAHDPSIFAQILLSPNIAIRDPNARMLNNPWGLQIAKQVLGGDYKIVEDTTALYARYWHAKYRVEALVQLEELVESAMTVHTFKSIKQPTLLLYYYKDQEHQDPVVRVDAMLEMYKALGTPEGKKSSVALADAGGHVLGSYIKSKDLAGVKNNISIFMNEKFGLQSQ